MSVTDYIGRTIDVAAFQGQVRDGESQLLMDLAEPGTGGQILTGIVKLGQRFFMELLTERGTMIYRPDRGTLFLTELREGQVRSQVDLLGAFSRALIDVIRNLQNEETDSDPDDERIKSADVINVEFSPGEAKVFVEVASQDATAKEILPIKISLR